MTFCVPAILLYKFFARLSKDGSGAVEFGSDVVLTGSFGAAHPIIARMNNTTNICRISNPPFYLDFGRLARSPRFYLGFWQTSQIRNLGYTVSRY